MLVKQRSCLKQQQQQQQQATTTNTNNNTTTKYVAFDKVVLNEFPIILGDNPAVVRSTEPSLVLLFLCFFVCFACFQCTLPFLSCF